jgi:hypothetical protein
VSSPGRGIFARYLVMLFVFLMQKLVSSDVIFYPMGPSMVFIWPG